MRLWPSALAGLLATVGALLVPAGIVAAPSSPYTYIHDDAGRLIAAVDPDDETARYHYDAAGNLVSIDRVSSAATGVLEIAPKGGAVGSKLTIYGTAFSATPGSNTVTINGTNATVTAATKSRLEVTVPLGATTGPVAVTGTGGTASSASDFTVGPTGPSISSVSASVADFGDTITITGQRFSSTASHNNVTINGTFAEVTSASATSLQVKVPPAGVSSGPIAVETPDGRDVTSGDLFLPPEPTLTPSDIGYTGRMSIGDTASITTPSAGKHGLVTFSGERGQRVALKVQNTGHAYSSMTLYGPNGLTVGPTTGASIYSMGMLDTVTLPDSGTYTLYMYPSGATSAASLSIYEVAADTVGEIEASGPQVTLTTTTPGQNHKLTFEGASGQRISLRVSNLTYGSGYGAYVSIRGPAGQELQAPAFANAPDGGFLDTLTLEDNGTYTVIVDPYLWATGTAKAQLFTVPGDATDTATPGGSGVTVTTTAPGQNAVVSFTATAGQRISAKLSDVSIAETAMKLRNPDGSTLAGPTYVSSGYKGYLEAVIPANGTYSVLVDPNFDSTGSATVTLYAPTDATGSISVNGTETTVTTTTPGQNASLTFSGTAGQRVSLTNTSSLSGDIWSYFVGSILMKDPSGNTIGSTTLGPPFPREFIDAVEFPGSSDPSGERRVASSG